MKRLGFSLIEMLIVIAVIALVMGMALAANREEAKEAHVRAVAQELASVLRDTRERAIKNRSVYAVVFNIENAPGTSGKILNNNSGGHWYRVLGPHSMAASDEVSAPPSFSRDFGQYSDTPIRLYLQRVEKAWIGEPHLLPKKRVRFIALNDQDNGDFRTKNDTYAPTYPRPWFGTWDETTKRVHPWGGYDPDLAMTMQTGPERFSHKPRTIGGRTISHSGFFYEGYDGPVVNCVNPSDRLVLDDTNHDGDIIINPALPLASDDPTKRYALWRSGEPRPLINAAWLDSMIVFNPDGTVYTSWLHMRHAYAAHYDRDDKLCYDPALKSTNGDALPAAGQYHLKDVSPFDRCNRIGRYEGYPRILDTYAESTSWVARSGYHFITLAPDMIHDNDTYVSADAYVRELSPCYRVGINAYGDIRIVRVRTTMPAGKLLDTTITGSDWNAKTTTDAFYPKGLLTNADGTPRGQPIIDAVTPEMLKTRTWWWQ